MTYSADSDQLTSSEANWSGHTLFAKTGHVVFSKRRVKTIPYDKGKHFMWNSPSLLQNIIITHMQWALRLQLYMYGLHRLSPGTMGDSRGGGGLWGGGWRGRSQELYEHSLLTESLKFQTRHSISYKIACTTSEDSDQPVHTHILSRTPPFVYWKLGHLANQCKAMSDQPAHLNRLIWVIANRTCRLVGNAVPMPIWCQLNKF